MPTYTFETTAAVSIHAETEEEARHLMHDAVMREEKDVLYGGELCVYLDPFPDVDPPCIDVDPDAMGGEDDEDD